MKPRSRTRKSGTGQPIYVQVANDLIEQIAAGNYPVGSVLPKEMDLSASYGVSRQTVREALRQLRDAGLVARRRRAGTEVIATEMPLRYRQPIGSINDLLQYAEGTMATVVRRARVRCGVTLARMLDCPTGREWLLIETFRTRPDDPRPICLTKNYLNLDLHGIEEAIEDIVMPISAMIERRFGLRITAIEQTIQAVTLGKRDARLLLAKPGDPALRALRRYYDQDNRLIELSDAMHPGDRFTYTMRLQRD